LFDEKGGESARTCARIGLREDNIDTGDAAVGHPTLCAIQDVTVALAARLGLNACSVRSSLRLGESESAENFPGSKATKVFFFLLLRAVFGDGYCRE
jgi:hypothetical protein